MLREHLPTPGEEKLVLACGPQPMIDNVLKNGLEKCGWDVDRQLVVF
jgi:nitrate reductase (NAD(P)H)